MTLLSNVILEPDVVGSRPAATDVPVGTLYAASDENIVYRSNGTTWDIEVDGTGGGGGGGITTPVLDLVERTTDLVVTATSAAAAQTWITGNSVAYDGSTRVAIEIYCPVANADTSNELICNIWEDSTDLGRVADQQNIGAVQGGVIRTPSNASHTYTAKVWKGSGASRQFSSGAASASGILVNSFLRVTLA